MRFKRFAIFCLDRAWQPWLPKAIVPRIADSELCYRRIFPGALLRSGWIAPAAYDFVPDPRPSCLRSAWADAADALHPKACENKVLKGRGVISIPARVLRAEMKLLLKRRPAFSVLFDVFPDPKPGCFSHSEIHPKGAPPTGTAFEVPELDEEARGEVRARLARLSKVEIAPVRQS